MTDTDREAFEAWARDSQQGYPSLKGAEPAGRGWYYFEDEVNDAWIVWRASRAALASRPAEVDPARLLREALTVAVKLRTDIDEALDRIGGAR